MNGNAIHLVRNCHKKKIKLQEMLKAEKVKIYFAN